MNKKCIICNLFLIFWANCVFGENWFFHNSDCMVSFNKSTLTCELKMTGNYEGDGIIDWIPSKIEYGGDLYQLRKIMDNAFSNPVIRNKIKKVVIPEGVETIGMSAFDGCKNMNQITLPNSLDSIGMNAFRSCESLNNLVIPPNVKFMSYSIFQYSTNLKNLIYLPMKAPQMWNGAENTYVLPGSNYKNVACAGKNCTTVNIIEMVNYGEEKYTYNGYNPNPNITCNMDGYSCVVDNTTLKSQAGSYSTSLNIYLFNDSIQINTEIPYSYTIDKAKVIATVNDAIKNYGSNNPKFTVSYTGFSNKDTEVTPTIAPVISTTATKYSGVGEYQISAAGAVFDNYEVTHYKEGVLKVLPAHLLLKANNAKRKYYEDEPIFTFSCMGFVNDDDVQVLTKMPIIKTEATKASNVGKYQISLSGAESNNYSITYEVGELTITKRSLNVTSHCSRLYGEEDPVFPIVYNGFVNNETENDLIIKPTGLTSATKKSNVGEYPIMISGGEATNYDFVYEPGVLTVEKAPLTAKVNDVTKVYGEQNPSFTIEYYGLKNNETIPVWTTKPSFQTVATKASGVGQYLIKAVNGIAKNYDLAIADGILNVTPAPLSIKANDATRLYYSDNPTFSFTCSGFVNGDDRSTLTSMPIVSTTATKTSNVGTYEIDVADAANPNYSIAYVNGKLTITPRTLTALVGNYERIYNEDNPEFEVKYDGFVGNEDETVLYTKAFATTTATKSSDVGTYPITVTGGIATNYLFSYKTGTLTIKKAEQSISWDQDLVGLKVDDQVELKAISTSGLPITYQLENSHIAEVYSAGKSNYLDCKAEGETQIVAVQVGNRNYYSSARIRKRIVIEGASDIISAEDSSLMINRTPFGVSISNVNIGEMIKVYSINGVLFKSMIVDRGMVEIPLTKGKMYIVKVGLKIIKIKL